MEDVPSLVVSQLTVRAMNLDQPLNFLPVLAGVLRLANHHVHQHSPPLVVPHVDVYSWQLDEVVSDSYVKEHSSSRKDVSLSFTFVALHDSQPQWCDPPGIESIQNGPAFYKNFQTEPPPVSGSVMQV